MEVLLGILAAAAVLAAARGLWLLGGSLGTRLGKGPGEAVAGACVLATSGLVLLGNYHPAAIPAAVVTGPLIYLEFAYFLPTGVAFFGLAARRVPDPRSSRAVGVLSAVMALYAALHVFLAFDSWSLPQLRAVPPGGPVCQQSTSWSCGPASCVTLLQMHGIASTEREMGELCMAFPRRGTTVPRFVRGLTLKLRKEGSRLRVRAEDRMAVAELDAFPLPALLGIKSTLFVDHAVVLAGRGPGGSFLVADPLTGRVDRMEYAEMRERFTGEAIALVE